MRSVTHQETATLHLLKVFLETLSSRGEQPVESKGKPALEDKKGAQPPAPAPPMKAHPGSTPGFARPAPVAANAVAVQMLATLMAQDDVDLAVLKEISADGEGRKDPERSEVKAEEAAPAQPKPGTANGSTPWLNEALAAYSARPTELVRLQPGVRPSGSGPGGLADSGGAKLSRLKLFRRALVYSCVIAAIVLLLLNRDALFG